MDPFAAIAEERRPLVAAPADATVQQRATPSPGAGWTVHDVLAHPTDVLVHRLPRPAATRAR